MTNRQPPFNAEFPATTPVVVDLPYYVKPGALRRGVTVIDTEDPDRTLLVVMHVEPTLVCRKPDGSVVQVFAHMAEIQTCEHCESDEHLAEDCLNGSECQGKCNV